MRYYEKNNMEKFGDFIIFIEFCSMQCTKLKSGKTKYGVYSGG